MFPKNEIFLKIDFNNFVNFFYQPKIYFTEKVGKKYYILIFQIGDDKSMKNEKKIEKEIKKKKNCCWEIRAVFISNSKNN